MGFLSSPSCLKDPLASLTFSPSKLSRLDLFLSGALDFRLSLLLESLNSPRLHFSLLFGLKLRLLELEFSEVFKLLGSPLMSFFVFLFQLFLVLAAFLFHFILTCLLILFKDIVPALPLLRQKLLLLDAFLMLQLLVLLLMLLMLFHSLL